MGKINRKDQHRTINYRDPADWRLQDGDARLITRFRESLPVVLTTNCSSGGAKVHFCKNIKWIQ